MADTLLTLTGGTLPEGYCYPATPQELSDDIFALATATFPGTLTSFGFGDTAPADTSIPWIRTVAGYFEGVYTYQGGDWVRPHPTPASGSERRIWVGSTADLETYDGGDTDPASDTSGPMWEVDSNFAFKFPIGVGTNGTTYDGNPATSVAVTGTGGVERIALATTELPAHTHDVVLTKGNSYTGGPNDPTVFGNGDADPTAYTQTSAAQSTGGDLSHQNMPPYYGVYFIKRTSRIYYTV